MNKLRVAVMGTTDFAVPALKKLFASDDYDVLCVVCQPDRPNGRGKKVRPLPMKRTAQALKIPVFQPEKIRDAKAIQYLKSLNADFFVVAAYGQILSQEVLDIPKYACVNIHGSLLPKYRGAAPIHHAIIDGENETGVSIMKMDAGMDTGAVYQKIVIPIDEHTTVGEMHDQMAEKGAEALLPLLKSIAGGSAKAVPQNSEIATYADKISKKTGYIDWNQPAEKIIRRINGTDPWPGAWCWYGKQKIKCFVPRRLTQKTDKAAGTVVEANSEKGLVVAAQDQLIAVEEIQFPGKRRMKAKDFLRGNTIEVGCVLK
ncbi:methionyl-tRNA formyltransferase [Pseudoramibacter sp.]|jgi:methionyl-tRNA formyltransferase|uniref:methionyl-tRNA formyltransferase n=1 Tax=Pseudoramibacter sp. TaxID=2034862 RepID=UPI0025FCB137|nr:methionyl-tRNA formyltransferase [Pseudoramibacter sp.]MCH4072718.1 methionyl-tRNA formyltransferase [Pseudoramibacter sp.]MCH4106489.1 methionyl-tRNA formyltransferase [Pseudoramibacter sp.]